MTSLAEMGGLVTPKRLKKRNIWCFVVANAEEPPKHPMKQFPRKGHWEVKED